MTRRINRRQMIGAAVAAMLAPFSSQTEVSVEISQVSPNTFRLTVGGAPEKKAGALVQAQWGRCRLRS